MSITRNNFAVENLSKADFQFFTKKKNMQSKSGLASTKSCQIELKKKTTILQSFIFLCKIKNFNSKMKNERFQTIRAPLTLLRRKNVRLEFSFILLCFATLVLMCRMHHVCVVYVVCEDFFRARMCVCFVLRRARVSHIQQLIAKPVINLVKPISPVVYLKIRNDPHVTHVCIIRSYSSPHNENEVKPYQFVFGISRLLSLCVTALALTNYTLMIRV